MHDLPLRTKGIFTLRTGRRLPRISTVSDSRPHRPARAMAIDRSSVGKIRQTSISPTLALRHRKSSGGRAAHLALEQQPGESGKTTRRLLLFKRRATDEIRSAGSKPPSRSGSEVERRGLIHVAAVQVHTGLEAQRVARAQPARLHTGLSQRRQRPASASGSIISKPSSPV